jgi:hypothetical protein
MSYYNVLFISETKLKENTAINDNVDSSELRFAIQLAQQIYIQETCGTNLFQKLQELVYSGDIELAGNINYKTLLNQFIQPCLIQYSYMLGLDNFYIKWVNVGLVQNRNEQGSNVDIKSLQYLKQNAKNQAEFLDNLLRRHLIFRSGLYPEYNNGNLNNGELPPQTDSAFRSSITTPGAGYYYRNKWKRNYNALGPLCGDSMLPTWYGSTTNSPGAHS